MKDNIMNKYEELKAWADKWGIAYTERPATKKWPINYIVFDSITWCPATFSFNPKTGEHAWYGGE